MNTSIITSQGTVVPMLRLALPVLVEQLLHLLVGLVDTWLTGNFLPGERYLAAIGLMSYVLWMLPSLFAAVAIGATALTSRFVGAGDLPLARRVTHQALLAGIGLAILVTVALAVGGGWFVAALRLPSDAAPLALRYLAILVPVIPAIMIEQVGIACLRGAGDTFSGLVVMAAVNTVNLAVSFLLVTGMGPLPLMGWSGLAIGTAVGHVVGAVLVLGLLVAGRAGLRLRLQRLRPEPQLIRRLFRVGLPGGGDVLAVIGCHLWFVGIINSLGTADAAAHGLAIRIESLAYLPGGAFQVAAATLAGQFLGAQDYRRATRSVLMACLMGGGLMVAGGAALFLWARPLTEFFLGPTQPAQTAVLAASLLRVVSLSMPFLALAMILTGALRGAGDTRWPLVFTFIGFLGVRIPMAYFLAWGEVPLPLVGITLPAAGWGVLGAWYGMVSDIVVRSVLVVYRFWHGGWRRIEV